MESQELKIFVEVAKYGSISKAAEQLGYVQSNITAHIKQLEQELGVALFTRSSKGVTLTKEGNRLLWKAKELLDLLWEMEEMFTPHPLHLKLATTQSIAQSYLTTALIQLQQVQPNMTFELITSKQETMEDLLRTQQLDCIVTNRTQTIKDAICILEHDEEVVLLAPSDCQRIEDAQKYPLVVNEIETCPYRNLLLKWNTDKARSLVVMDTIEAMISFVEQGGGVSLLPKKIVEGRTDINTFAFTTQTKIRLWIGKDKEEKAFATLKTCLKEAMKK